MKKSLLALAVLGAFAGVASAQSAVTLYGLLDVGLARTDPGAAGVASTTAMLSGVQSGSRVGLRGSEDLGGGLRAVFNIESGLNVDDGSQAAAAQLWNRWAYVGLAGGFGELRFGRQNSAGFELFGAVDPWATGFRDAGSQVAFSSANALRVNNAIVYRSPVVGGFAGVIGYSLNPLGQEVAGGSDLNNRTITAGARFASGPFLGVFTYESVSFAGPDQVHMQLGAVYDAKVVRIHAMYGTDEDQRVAGPRGLALVPVGVKATNWMLGVTVPLGAASLIVSYADRDGDNDTLAQGADGNSFALGGTYTLSRRTNLYAVYSDLDAKNVPASGVDRTEFAIGLRHTF